MNLYIKNYQTAANVEERFGPGLPLLKIEIDNELLRYYEKPFRTALLRQAINEGGGNSNGQLI